MKFTPIELKMEGFPLYGAPRRGSEYFERFAGGEGERVRRGFPDDGLRERTISPCDASFCSQKTFPPPSLQRLWKTSDRHHAGSEAPLLFSLHIHLIVIVITGASDIVLALLGLSLFS